MVYRVRMIAAAAAVAVVVASCGSSSKTSGDTSATRGGISASADSHTYTIGVLTDLTGAASNYYLSVPQGIKAGIGRAATEGYKIHYVLADTTSTPNGTLVAAQRLVEQDHVFAVIALSAFTFAASKFLSSHGIPVVGAATDGSEWITTKDMFSIYGTSDFTKVQTTEGLFLKLLGVTNLASTGYGVSPSSTEAAKAAAISAEAAGIKVGYLNANIPFGTTNVGPLAIAMKNAGVNGLNVDVQTETGLSLAAALHQEGVVLKGTTLPTGYGGDLETGGPGAEQNAQGLYFVSAYEPVELHTAATESFQSDLKAYAGVTGDPTSAEYVSYLSIDGLVTGLKAAGPNPSQASFINAMLGVTSYNAAGLFGSHSIGFAMDQRGIASGADNCFWGVQYSGTTFHPVKGAEPICGTVIPGKTVSPSS